jgi:hypothetical protein
MAGENYLLSDCNDRPLHIKCNKQLGIKYTRFWPHTASAAIENILQICTLVSMRGQHMVVITGEEKIAAKALSQNQVGKLLNVL